MSDLKSRAIPYGYKMVNGIVTVNEEEANIVLKIYADRLEGVGVYAIGKALYESQIPFFCDSRDKAIKKASAILYKSIYCGEKGYPAIVDKDSFDRVQKMKTKPIRNFSVSNDKPEIADNAEYDYVTNDEIKPLEDRVRSMIENHTSESDDIRKMIYELAARKYDCITEKGASNE